MVLSEIGETLKECRKSRGWTLAEASRQTGYHTSSIKNMEKGSGHVLWRRYCIYMHHLGITWELVPNHSTS